MIKDKTDSIKVSDLYTTFKEKVYG